MKSSEILRCDKKGYKELNTSEKKYTEEQILDLMIKYLDLIQRPIFQKGEKAILARPSEKMIEFF